MKASRHVKKPAALVFSTVTTLFSLLVSTTPISAAPSTSLDAFSGRISSASSAGSTFGISEDNLASGGLYPRMGSLESVQSIPVGENAPTPRISSRSSDSALEEMSTEDWPRPFDSTLSYQLSDNCVAFMTKFLTSDQMTGKNGQEPCRSFGLLRSSSFEWTQLVRQPERLEAALGQMCHPPSDTYTESCKTYFTSTATLMVKQGNCKADLEAKNSVALEALNGLESYEMMQKAACLENPETGSYCYTEAMTQKKPDDAYLWNLVSGTSLPQSSLPSCSSCSKSLLSLFATSTSTKYTKSDFSTALINATDTVQQKCGANFVEGAQALKSSSSDVSIRSMSGLPSWTSVIWITAAILTWSSQLL